MTRAPVLLVSAPLVLTLMLDAASQEWFDVLRSKHFPPERNHLAAHVTLFHALPGNRLEQVTADVRAAAAREPFPVAVTGVRSLGRGVAYELAAAELSDLHADLSAQWQPWLTAQDRRRIAPHVTVQNKVEPAAARRLHAQLSAGFRRFEVTAQGLALWRYEGGPWSAVAAAPFRTQPTAAA